MLYWEQYVGFIVFNDIGVFLFIVLGYLFSFRGSCFMNDIYIYIYNCMLVFYNI